MAWLARKPETGPEGARLFGRFRTQDGRCARTWYGDEKIAFVSRQVEAGTPVERIRHMEQFAHESARLKQLVTEVLPIGLTGCASVSAVTNRRGAIARSSRFAAVASA